MEKVTLKNYIFDNLFSKVEGMTLKEIQERSKEITKTFKDFKKILITNGLISINNKVSGARLVNHNGIEYFIIKKTSGEYVIIDLTNNRFLNNNDKDLFTLEFFINLFQEKHKTSYDSYMFDSKGGSYQNALEFFLRHQKTLELDQMYIYYTISDEIASSIVYYNIASGETVIHFKTKDNMSNTQIYLYDEFSQIENEQELTSKIQEIKVPFDKIPNYLKKDKIKKNNY